MIDHLDPETISWTSDMDGVDPDLVPIILARAWRARFSNVAPAVEECGRWAPVVTVKDAERVFNRTKSPRSGHLEEAVDYQKQ